MKKRHISIIFLLTITFSLISSASAASDVTWGPAHEDDASFEWKITELEDENGSTTWDWICLGETLAKDDVIKFEWTSFNDTYIEVTKDSPSDGLMIADSQGFDITVGGTKFGVNESKALMWLVLPMFMGFADDMISGPITMEGYFHMEYPLPQAMTSYSWYDAQSVWQLNVEKETAEVDVIGPDAEEDAVIKAHIISTHYPKFKNGTNMPTGSGESMYAGRQIHYVFDLTFDAKNGVLKSLKYPSTVAQTTPNSNYPDIVFPIIAGNHSQVTDGLAKLEIDLTSTVEGDWPAAAPGFELAIVTTSFVILAAIISRRRKE
jgi:hypothetical protein